MYSKTQFTHNSRRSPGLICTILALFVLAFASSTLATAQTAIYTPKQSDRAIPVKGDEPGFRPIFDGKTLAGWDGDPAYWRVENGIMVGEITPATLVKSNTFIIWQDGQPKDFELKLEFRISTSGNSGINYRSLVVPDPVTPTNQFAMRGYQCDIDGRNRYSGNNYEEKGRLFLGERGQLTRVTGGQPPSLLARLGDSDDLSGLIKSEDWNEIHLIIRGNTLTHIINGRVMCVVIDDDIPNRPESGSIGMQVHVGPPMKIEYRNIRIKAW